MGNFIKICHTSDIPEGECRKFELQDEEVAVFRIRAKYYILSNYCSHMHVPVIADGMIDGLSVICPRHGWIFDLETGASKSGDSRIKKYDYKIENEEIFVELKDSWF